MSRGGGEPQFSYEDHFTPARTRKKRKNRQPADRPDPTVLLEKTSEELARTNWLRDTQQALRESLEGAFALESDVVPDVLCLGLGSPASSRDARAQLAFLLAACDDLRIPRKNVYVFDPVFTDQDRELLAQLGLTSLPENRVARHRVQSPTIVFMPHCDLHLYDNLFRENWGKEQLPRILLIANRLSEYAANIPSRKLNAEYPCVARLAPYLTSRPLQPSVAFPTAFNNTAFQFVSAGSLAERSLGDGEDAPDWWTLPPMTTTATETVEASEAVHSVGPGDDIATPGAGSYSEPKQPRVGSADASPTSASRSAMPITEAPSAS
ncbi:SRR1-domain-containing protein [Dichomitus squalens]|nr:SRR1-domain-containing protein [Dichomitus squalens]